MNKNIVTALILIIVLGMGIFIWIDGGHPSTASNTPSPSLEPTLSVQPTSSPEIKTYTLIDVAKHKDIQSCWAVIRNKVYDLTKWIPNHPGGPQRILSICGTDATAKFESQHDNQPKPNNQLNSFYIGDLSQ